jgi:hypothetical protein
MTSRAAAPVPPAPETARGAAPYSLGALAIYDAWVHGLSNTFAWRCPLSMLQSLYQRNASARHLDAGVGTGLLLARTKFPAGSSISLLDLNPISLRYTARRLREHSPLCHHGDVLAPATLKDLPGSPFDSVALMYLLHCLPGTLASKSSVFASLGGLLSGRGVLFGATILGKSAVPHNVAGRCLMHWYNRSGVFSNRWDTLEDLQRGLDAHFHDTSVRVQGQVALFEARRFKSAAGDRLT